MSTSTEKVTLQVTFPKEKLEALRFYMNEKQLTVEEELQKHIKNTYDKYVPSATRRYLDRNDNREEIEVVTNENEPETTPRNTTAQGRRRTGRSQSAEGQSTAETVNTGEIEETSEQTEEQNQGMTMSM
ncbi:hypothetical protein SAMN02745784_02192 [Tissierella praeacuta DSM 18095]|uniref:Uncharacterized protein n=1 Tax=Tissierella praeacuta DSM 18095 TaxID=1123404 RepID=A0A1M4XBU0_9FIRM|nr:DUF6103 family protein [Tissierella praeacuta]SHE90652.1 hypothetical protein SAMN02745784_02192 [Tissierella praeacuta DSM 18095]SUP02591.1 Uncharacterised protein [Tissierella praeacuta]